MKVLIAGDFCPILRVEKAVISENYQSLFGNVRDIIANTDCAIVNLECPVIKNSYPPLIKCGPNLKGHTNTLKAIKYAGFNIVTLANNHILDYGKSGVTDTIEICNQEGIKYVGAGENIDASSRILYHTYNGQRLAIINCCEHEFSIAGQNQAGANPLNPMRQYYAIKEAKEKSDYVIVIIHGGNEHYEFPSPRMIDTYRFFIDVGADAVVNHHQHCYSGYETYHNKPIFYGLGNFCFDHKTYRNSKWNDGYMVIIDFAATIKYRIIPYKQNSEQIGVHVLPENSFDSKIESINNVIANKDLCNNYYVEFAKSKKIFNDFIFEPYNNVILKKIFFRGLLPQLFPYKKKILMENIIKCESHRDTLLSYLKMLRICRKF